MASRDIWSRSGGLQVRDLLASLLATRFLAGAPTDPLYVCSPYLTDFPLFDNAFGQFGALFPANADLAQRPEILFSEALIELSRRQSVRIIALDEPHTENFLQRVVRVAGTRVAARHARSLHHEKGLLCSAFYIEGSMNFTYSGVYRRDEKITIHTPDTAPDREKIGAAEFEFERLWKSRESQEVPTAP